MASQTELAVKRLERAVQHSSEQASSGTRETVEALHGNRQAVESLRGSLEGALTALGYDLDEVADKLDMINETLQESLGSIESELWRGNVSLTQLASSVHSPSATKATEYLDRAKHSLERGWWQEAIGSAEEAVKEDPLNGIAYLILGTALVHENRLKDAADAFAKSARYCEVDQPSVAAQALYHLALAEAATGNRNSKIEHLTRALALDSTSAAILLELALEAQRQRLGDRVVTRIAASAILIDPSLVAAEENMPPRIAEELRSLYDRSVEERRAKARDLVARLIAELGDAAEVVTAAAEQVASIAPGDPHPLSEMARGLSRLRDEAKRMLAHEPFSRPSGNSIENLHDSDRLLETQCRRLFEALGVVAETLQNHLAVAVGRTRSSLGGQRDELRSLKNQDRWLSEEINPWDKHRSRLGGARGNIHTSARVAASATKSAVRIALVLFLTLGIGAIYYLVKFCVVGWKKLQAADTRTQVRDRIVAADQTSAQLERAIDSLNAAERRIKPMPGFIKRLLDETTETFASPELDYQCVIEGLPHNTSSLRQLGNLAYELGLSDVEPDDPRTLLSLTVRARSRTECQQIAVQLRAAGAAVRVTRGLRSQLVESLISDAAQ